MATKANRSLSEAAKFRDKARPLHFEVLLPGKELGDVVCAHAAEVQASHDIMTGVT